MKDFNRWNELKKKIDDEKAILGNFPKEGEVWMAEVGLNIGCEQNGSEDSFTRPVLIVKKFNNSMFWVVPLSTKQKSLDFYFNFTDQNNQRVSAILAQMKLASAKRLKRDIYIIPQELFLEIRQKLKEFL